MAEQNVNSSATTTISLEETLKAILPDGKVDGKLPPVHLWNPERSADINMEIRADGSWWHEGDPINRERLVKLFSRILRKDEDGSVWLVTPYEKVIVHVADAPFLAVRVETDPETGEPSPYVLVRGQLEAKLARPVFYELANMAEPAPDGSDMLGVWSQGVFFPLGPAA